MPKTENKYIKKNTLNLFYIKIILPLIILVIMLLSACIVVDKNCVVISQSIGDYKEKNNISYLVNLKDNNYYTEKYLPQGQAYLTKLIKTIDFDYNKELTLNKKAKGNLEYRIIAKLNVYGEKSNKPLYTHDYPITENKIINLDKKAKENINEKLIIDYSKYNSKANELKNKYNLETTSDLQIVLEAKNYLEKNNYEKTIATIPLQKETISIIINEKDTNNIINKTDAKIKVLNMPLFTTGLTISFVSVVILVIRFKKVLNIYKKGTYKEKLGRILIDYDRFIEKTSVMPKQSSYEVIKLDSIEELVDTCENVKAVIKYYEVAKNSKSHFYVINGNIMYLYTIKNLDN